MFKNLFKSADTKAALEELKKLSTGEHSIAFSYLSQEITNILTDSNGKAVSVQVEAGFTHSEIVHLAAKTILERKLPSGEYHVFPGILDIVGNDMWKLYYASLYILAKAKPLEADEETIQREISVMREAIAKVG